MQTGSDEKKKFPGGICDDNSEAPTVTVLRHLLALYVIACDFKTQGCWENGSDEKLLCATTAEDAVREELLKLI